MERDHAPTDAGGRRAFLRSSETPLARELDNRTYSVETVARSSHAVNADHRFSVSAPLQRVPTSFAGWYLEMFG